MSTLSLLDQIKLTINCPASVAIAGLHQFDIVEIAQSYAAIDDLILGDCQQSDVALERKAAFYGAVSACRDSEFLKDKESYAIPGDHCKDCSARTWCRARERMLTGVFNGEKIQPNTQRE